MSIEYHAAYIWRRQFEDISVIDVGRSPRPNVSSDIILRRWKNIFTTGNQIPMNEQLCCTVARAMWQVALRVAQAWRVHIETAQPKNINLILETPWLLRLGRWDLDTSSPLGFAIRESPSGFDELFIFLA